MRSQYATKNVSRTPRTCHKTTFVGLRPAIPVSPSILMALVWGEVLLN